MEQLELPLEFAPDSKPPERRSAGRRSVDAMVIQALQTGAAHNTEDLLDQIASIPDRALFNALLAVLQFPRATMLCSAAEWDAKWGRRIVPGQRPIVLMFPFGPVEFVFDLSQTEPTPQARSLPIQDAPFAMDAVSRAGESVARLVAESRRSGVRTVSARQGVGLAGQIQRVHDAGTLTVPSEKPGQQPTEVPVRWVVSLNESHRPTEQLAALAHELGHLFCGHVGADRGDAWPRRLVAEEAVREFEAESVARLVFRRIAPEASLPPCLEHLLPPGQPPPDDGWTYVVQAADRILNLLGDARGPER